MFDIITFGSATNDCFLKLKDGNFKIGKDKNFSSGKSLSFSFGSKIDVAEILSFTGGGATNTAVSFSNQGLKTACVSKIGNDKMGDLIKEVLEKNKVNTELLIKDKKYFTDHSVILSVPHKERTILVYHGASRKLKKKEISFKKLLSKWFYIAPLSSESADLFIPIVEFAYKNKIKIAANPGNSQINIGLTKLKPILSKIDVLFLNYEEASLLTGENLEKRIIKKLSDFINGVCVITKGEKGAIAFDSDYIYLSSISKSSFVEKTGAGDAFSSGFLSGFISKNDISYAIQLGTANATSCIQEVGAKNGLLKKGKWGNFKKVDVIKTKKN